MLTWHLLSLWTGAIAVAGDCRCPTPAAVAAALERLSLVEVSPGNRAVLEERLEGFRLELLDARGRELGARTFTGERSCADRAEISAVTLAAWLAELAPPPPELPAPLPPVPVPTLAVAAAVPTSRPPWGLELGASGLASFAEGPAPGGLISVALRPAGSLILGAAILGEGIRGLPVGSGELRWQRWALSVSGGYRWQLQRLGIPVIVELQAQELTALLRAEGQGFAPDQSTNQLDVGLGPGLEIALDSGELRPFLGVWPVYWLRHEEGQVQLLAGAGTDRALPQWELLAGLGVSWVLF